jgi:RNA polymerase sigma-70 factor (ECF subfamily)
LYFPLTQRLIDGDESAFEELFRQFYFPMRAYAFRFVRSMTVAEDIVQDVFLKLWASHEQIGNIRSMKAWLFTSAHHEAVNYLKHKIVEEKYSHHVSADDAAHSSVQDNDVLFSQEKVQFIKNTVKTLPEQTRRIFLLSRQYRLKNKDIAEFLDIHIKTVEKHISIALQHLRANLGEF